MMLRLFLALMLVPCLALAQTNSPRDAASIGSLTGTGDLIHTTLDYGFTDIPDGRSPDKLGFPVDVSAWDIIDVTQATDAIGEDMTSLGCGGNLADPVDNAHDDGPSIRCAEAASGSGGRIIYLPAGDYEFNTGSGGEGVLQVNRAQTLLRGAGVGLTFVRATINSGETSFVFGTKPPFTPTPSNYTYGSDLGWSGAAAGVKTLTLTAVTGLAIGDFVAMTANKPSWCYTDVDRYLEIRKLTCVGTTGADSCGGLGATQVKLDLALRGEFTTGGTTFRELTNPREIGVEGIYFKNDTGATTNTRVGAMFGVVQAWNQHNKWERGSDQIFGYLACAYCYSEGNWFDQVLMDNAGNKRGIEQSQVDESAFVNNIVSRANVGIQWNQSSAVTGLVTSANYLPNPPRQDVYGVDCLDSSPDATPGACHPIACNAAPSSCDCTDDGPGGIGQAARALMSHGSCHKFNINELNDLTCRSQHDQTFGYIGKGNTTYRNRSRKVSGTVSAKATGCIGPEFDPDAPFDWIHLGNFAYRFGDCAADGAIDGNDATANTAFFWGERNVAYGQCLINKFDGERDAACSPGSGTGAANTISMWSNNTVADQSPASWTDTETYPSSLVYDSQPSWWCDEACPWSAVGGIGAFGDDFNAGSPTYCKLPAQILYEGGTCTLAADPNRRLGPGTFGGSVGDSSQR